MFGIIGIGAGVLTFLWPNITALVLLLLIAFWAIATGVMEIIGAIRLRKEIDNEWLLAASGLVSVLFGLLLLTRPEAGALALITVIGAFAILHGLLLVWFSLRLRGTATPLLERQGERDAARLIVALVQAFSGFVASALWWALR